MSDCEGQSAHKDAKDIGTNKKSINGNARSSRAVCGVCKRLYREPKLLSCLHTFCADCIRQLEAFSLLSERGESSARERVLCPACDSEVELPRAGVDGLTTDHLALDEVFMETLLLDKSAVCDLCGDAEAEQRCEVCSHNLCDFCSQAHRRQKRTSNHAIHSVEELKRQGRLSRPVLCSLHPDQELRLFCETCDLTICLECAATFHRGHRCNPMHEVVHRHGDRIRELVSRSLRPRLVHLEEAVRCVEVSQEALQSRAEAMASEIQAFAQAYMSAVETHCRSLLHSLEELRLQRRNQLQLQKAQLQQALCDIRGSVDFAERLLTCGSEAEILSVKEVTTRRLMSLLELGCNPQMTSLSHATGGSICFLPQELAEQVDGFPMVGVLQARTVDPSRCTIEGE
ncbi:tripartite motif-containing protein 45, partial [Clarias magur]